MKNFRECLNAILPRRIWQQLFFVLFFLVVIPLVILGTLLIRTSQQAVKTSVLRDNEQIAIRTAREIERSIKFPREILASTAAILGALPDDSWKQETVLVELGLQQPIFRRIAVVDLNGREVTSSELGTPLRDRSREISFSKARAGEQYFSEVVFTENHLPMATMSVPVEKFNKVVGVLMAEVRLRGVWDIIDSIHVGKTGKASVISATGQLISDPDKKLVLLNEDFSSQQIVKNVLLGKTGSREQPSDHGAWLVSYAPIAGMKWGLILAQSTTEAYSFSRLMQAQAWGLIFLSVLATVLMSLLLARFITRPVNMLIKGTRSIARGDFDCQLRVNRKDETGELLEAFNMMAVKLKDVQRIEKLSVIGKAATTIAHELKNSLTLINTYIQILPHRCHDRKFVEEFSRIVPQELASWKAMLKNMTDYAKVSQFPVELVNIEVLVGEVAIMARERATQQGIHFKLCNKHPLPSIRGHGEKIKQVLLNLLSNAFEAIDDHGEITLSTEFVDAAKGTKTPHIKIQMEDTGKGIPEQDLKRIFEPFYTTRPNGLGLGLSISKDIVEQHLGWIEVSSQVNLGAVFTVWLPAVGAKTSPRYKKEEEYVIR